MLTAEQLRAAGLACFPVSVRRDPATGQWDKKPAVPQGEHWGVTAQRPLGDPVLNWSSGVYGLPIPDSVAVLDLDEYKGITPADVDQLLGTHLDWHAAKIQTTISGGAHYAFRCSWPVRQGDSIGLPGFDTRAAGRGFIATGQGYTPAGLGVFALAYPQALPELPDAARGVLERHEAAPKEYTASEADDGEVIQALHHIDPGCSRAEWVRIGLALRHHYQNDEDAGEAVFARWSAGEFWPGGAPHNYNPHDIAGQWGSFSPEGGTTVATLFYKAIQCGWTPPARFDVSGAFGPGAASADFESLVRAVRIDGGDAAAVPGIIEKINAAGCDELQRALLAAELKKELKDKKAGAYIDQVLGLAMPKATSDGPTPAGAYGKNDTDNAVLFLDSHYPDGTLCQCDQLFYRFTGKAWEHVTDEQLRHQVAVAMAPHRVQESKVSACYRMVRHLIPNNDGALHSAPKHLIVFDNGVLDLNTGQLHPHDRGLFTTYALPYPFDVNARCPEWAAFLSAVMDNDPERIALLQEWLGYVMTRDYRHHKILVLDGDQRSGKGTIGSVAEWLVGTENFTGADLCAFTSDSFLDGLRTKSLAFVTDAESRIPPAVQSQVVSKLKRISANDQVNFDRKFIKGLSERLPARIMIACNGIPDMFDDSAALAGRMLVIPLFNSWLNREDLDLGAKLRAEMPGIAQWALEGLRRLNTNRRFTQPQVSHDETQALREAQSPTLRFIAEQCDLGPGLQVPAKEFYLAYRDWCLFESETPMAKRTFTKAMKDATRSKGVRYTNINHAGGWPRGFTGIQPRPLEGVIGPAAAFTTNQRAKL